MSILLPAVKPIISTSPKNSNRIWQINQQTFQKHLPLLLVSSKYNRCLFWYFFDAFCCFFHYFNRFFLIFPASSSEAKIRQHPIPSKYCLVFWLFCWLRELLKALCYAGKIRKLCVLNRAVIDRRGQCRINRELGQNRQLMLLCNLVHVALAEYGNVQDVFSNPQSEITKLLLDWQV